jgi:putative ABC transport system ATP-binding protein
MSTLPLDLRIRNLGLVYPLPGGGRLQVLDLPTLEVPAGCAVGITGPSGSGKTSVLYVCSGLERPQSGTVTWGETELTRMAEGERDRWRRRYAGFVFQDFHLFPGMSVLQNVLLPARFQGFALSRQVLDRAQALLARVGLDHGRRDLETLSRGEMQRVAVARALLNAPPILLADEPTASLDAEAAAAVGDLLLGACRETGSTLILVSHDRELLRRLDTVLTLVHGRLACSEEALTVP